MRVCLCLSMQEIKAMQIRNWHLKTESNNFRRYAAHLIILIHSYRTWRSDWRHKLNSTWKPSPTDVLPVFQTAVNIFKITKNTNRWDPQSCKYKYVYNIPRAWLLDRSPVPAMDLNSNRSGLWRRMLETCRRLRKSCRKHTNNVARHDETPVKSC